MKQYQPMRQGVVLERPLPEPPKMVSGFECIYGKHPAEIMHRGTAYCRFHYDEKNPYGKLIDP